MGQVLTLTLRSSKVILILRKTAIKYGQQETRRSVSASSHLFHLNSSKQRQKTAAHSFRCHLVTWSSLLIPLSAGQSVHLWPGHCITAKHMYVLLYMEATQSTDNWFMHWPATPVSVIVNLNELSWIPLLCQRETVINSSTTVPAKWQGLTTGAPHLFIQAALAVTLYFPMTANLQTF